MPEVIVGRDEDDTKRYGTDGTLYIGRHIVGIGEETHLTTPLLLDAVRPHIITITGKRGEGKCVDGDTLIVKSDGSLVKIKELVDDCGVISLDENMKIVKSSKKGLYKRKVNQMLEIRLRTGKKIKLTPEHPLFTVKGWKQASAMSVGSRIATPRKIDAFSTSTTEDYKVKILAYLIAEGHAKKQGKIDFVKFVNYDSKIKEEFRSCIHEFDNNLCVAEYRKHELSIHDKRKPLTSISERDVLGRIVASSKQSYGNSIVSWLSEINSYGELAKNKTIPDLIFRLEKKPMSIFLNRLFSCDGSIYLREGLYEISYCSSSERMIKQIQHLLLRFGIVSKLKPKTIKLNDKEFTSFELLIRGEFVNTFIHEIGFYGTKEIRANDALTRIVKRNSNTDTIPKEVWDFFTTKSWSNLGRAFNYKYPKAMRESIRYAPSRQKLLQIANVENHRGLKTLAESDIFWDEIVAIELLEGDFEVYDISVPEYHNFVANDIIIHNSYSMGVLVEEMLKLPNHIKKNLCGLIIDTQGIYWTMKSPAEKDATLLKQWALQPSGFDVAVYVPEGQEKIFSSSGVDYDATFSFSPSQLKAEDWLAVFDISPNTMLGILLQRTINKMSGQYSIDDIIKSVNASEGFGEEKLGLENRFEAAKGWGIFGDTRMPSLLEPGRISIIDLSLTPQNVRGLLVALASQSLYIDRVTARRKEELAEIEMSSIKRTPMPWLFIDEAHNYLPADKITPATDILNRIVKEGRQPGITLVFATQRPEKLHPDALAQTDMIISHRLTGKSDVDALKAIMQTYLLYDIGKYINELPKLKGVAIILDDNSERLYKVRIRPRQSWHAGSSPVAI